MSVSGRSWYLLAAALTAAAVSAQEAAPRLRPIRGMRYPAVSPDGSRIVFTYRGDLWTVPAAGGEAKRLAELPGFDSRARWSPDGKTIAFSSNRNNGFDLYTISAEGGEAKQITFHSSDDILGGWSPDGKSLSFYSLRETRASALYSVSLVDGRVRLLSTDEVPVYAPMWSPDGKTVTYYRGGTNWSRKKHRSSGATDVWTMPVEGAERTARQITQTEGGELWPFFAPDGRSLYFVSDRDGRSALWRGAVKGGGQSPVFYQPAGYLHYPDLSRTGKTLVYQADFSLWAVDPTASKPQPRRLEITAAVPDPPAVETRKITSGATELEISPDGSQLLLVLRNDLFLLPATGGEAKRITDSLARDWDAGWSPDGQKIVFVSEREANSDLYVYELATGTTRRLTTDPAPDTNPQFSPDGTRVVFLRGNSGSEVRTLALASGKETVVAGGGFLSDPRWSPDSRWIAYSRRTPAAISNVYVARDTGEREVNLTRWNGSNFAPVWSPDGKRLTFLSNRSGVTDIFTVELSRPGASTAAAAGATGPGPVVIDPAGIERRVKPLVERSNNAKFSPIYTPDGRAVLFSMAGTSGVWSVPVTGGTATRAVESLNGSLRLSADGATLYGLSARGQVQRVPRLGGAVVEISYSAAVPVDAPEERRQTFDQAWRLLSDQFYDPKMHGVDWAEVRRRYRPVVDESGTLEEFHLLLAEMTGELNASHLGVYETQTRTHPSETASLGVLIDWEYPGPGLKVASVLSEGPAAEDASRLLPGEVILAIGGKDVNPTESFFPLLAGQAGKRIELLVNSRPDKNGARTVSLTPVRGAAARDLIYEDWVKAKRERVRELSGGKLSYLHIRAMNQESLRRFERELVTEAYDQPGLVLDIRYNGGGRIHDELFALLTRKVHVFETPRGGAKMTQPFGAFDRPSVLLINENCFSDAEIFANGFRANRLGKVVGRPTAGGVIGTGDLPLLDGQTTFRVPRTYWETLDGVNLENTGVRPDVEVFITPDDIRAGRDPQLEAAVKELLKTLPRKRGKPASG